ncbi:MAG TPA: decarboxylating NADP(+)-dependent phosphogluconate dehydrogenase [Rectinemataceae bacterium]|nr:decarboxylating NADP(+)-dependent phosphogluconate dehydrogenase [Rectinemataceae bacterium]
MEADIGLIGLAVMGQNLVLNMNDHGYSVAVYNRTHTVTEQFLSGPAAGRSDIVGARSLEELCASLARPRKVMLLIKAGAPVDEMLEHLGPFLESGDIVIDGGNSYFEDTVRRVKSFGERGIHFVGMGVSGGEEGARNGPSLMPGGDAPAWAGVRSIFTDIAAKTATGESCCAWIGSEGAGHFVKMVHNGIEYGDMELIAETYHLMREAYGMSAPAMADAFRDWNRTELESYLIEITEAILRFPDPDGSPLVERILDSAGQKGTGKWVSQTSLDAGVPLTLITEAVFARFLSALVEERADAADILEGPKAAAAAPTVTTLEDLRRALLAAKIVSYAQGFMLMREVGSARGWDLDYGSIAQVWRGGCIIRSAFLDRIKQAFDRDAELPSLLVDTYFAGILGDCQAALRRVVAAAAATGVPIPSLSAALAFYDGYRCARLPANLIQAQRDYFGAHTYERVDRPRGEFHHTDWTGTGGPATSNSYNA